MSKFTFFLALPHTPSPDDISNLPGVLTGLELNNRNGLWHGKILKAQELTSTTKKGPGKL